MKEAWREITNGMPSWVIYMILAAPLMGLTVTILAIALSR